MGDKSGGTRGSVRNNCWAFQMSLRMCRGSGRLATPSGKTRWSMPRSLHNCFHSLSKASITRGLSRSASMEGSRMPGGMGCLRVSTRYLAQTSHYRVGGCQGAVFQRKLHPCHPPRTQTPGSLPAEFLTVASYLTCRSSMALTSRRWM